MAISPVNSNPYFETDATGWTATGGTAVRSTAQFHEGAASLLLTPDGVSASASAACTMVAGADPGEAWSAQAWVRCAATRNVNVGIHWYDGSGVFLSSSTSGGTYAVTANTWTAISITGTAPASAAHAAMFVSMTSTPPAGNLLYIDEAKLLPPGQLIATPEPGNDPPRVLLSLEFPGQTEATIVRIDPDGSQTTVRLAEPATLDGGGAWIGYDYESWFEGSTSYTATTSGGTASSATVTLDVSDVWLRHPGIPSLSMQIDFQGDGTPVRPVVQAVLEPLGRIYPVVVSDGRRKAKRGEITIRTKLDAEHTALAALVDDVVPLLLDVPPSKGYGVDLTHQYLAVGDLTQARLRPDYYPHPWRIWTAPYIVVGRPAGGIQAERTYADVLADHATYQELITTYATYTELLTGV